MRHAITLVSITPSHRKPRYTNDIPVRTRAECAHARTIAAEILGLASLALDAPMRDVEQTSTTNTQHAHTLAAEILGLASLALDAPMRDVEQTSTRGTLARFARSLPLQAAGMLSLRATRPHRSGAPPYATAILPPSALSGCLPPYGRRHIIYRLARCVLAAFGRGAGCRRPDAGPSGQVFKYPCWSPCGASWVAPSRGPPPRLRPHWGLRALRARVAPAP